MGKRSSGGARRRTGPLLKGGEAYKPRITAEARQRLELHREWLKEHEPDLQLTLTPEEGRAEITGTLRLTIGAGIPRDFQLRLVYQRSSNGALNPFRPPDTYETGGRFPHGEPDRHIESNGRFCLWLPLATPTDFDGPNGLALHLDRVRQFLRLQLIYEDRKVRGLTPAWPGPEWKHGLDGYRQWVQEHTAGIDRPVLIQLVLAVWNIHNKRRPIHPTSPCPCRSGRIWKSCHSAWASPLLKALKDPRIATAVLSEMCDLLEEKDGQAGDEQT